MNTCKTLSIDIETFSDVSIDEGVYKYVDSDQFEVLMVSYAYDNEDVQIVDLKNGETLPYELIEDLLDTDVVKCAFNAQFERICLSKMLYKERYPQQLLSPKNWQCTAVLSAMLGLPRSLEKVGEALNLDADKQKSKIGKSLIQYFSIPCKPTKTNGGRTRNLPQHDLDRWQLFKDYCIQDVVVEREIRKTLKPYDFNVLEQSFYELDQIINDRGIGVDVQLVDKVLQFDEQHKDKITQQLYALTQLNNPNSVSQLKEWMSERLGYEVSSLTKESVDELIRTCDDEQVVEVLRARQELSKTSIKKFNKIQDCMLHTNSVHGVLQFYGANRTGRWAGRLVQVHNLPRNYLKELDDVREIVKNGDTQLLTTIYDNVTDVLSQLIRTAFIPKCKKLFVVCDFSAIEARVIAWLAHEQWRLDVFASHGKIYEASAAAMFKVPFETITKDSPLRQKGKVAELACGYQGGVGALKAMGADDIGLSEDEMQQLIDNWRASNPKIVTLWKEVERAVKQTLRTGETQYVTRYKLKIVLKGRWLFIILPNGRHLAYAYPKLQESSFGSKITYMGLNQTSNKWERQDTYGGKLVENIVQAIARDCLAHTLYRVEQANMHTVLHVHDEIVIESDNAVHDLEQLKELFKQPIPWAIGLQLKGEGFISSYYMKD